MTKAGIIVLLFGASVFSLSSYAKGAGASAEAAAEATLSSPIMSSEQSLAPPSQMDTPGEAEAASKIAADAGFQIDATINIDISAEQAAQIRQLVLDAGVTPVPVDFNVSIGAPIPTTLTLSLMPTSVVAIAPGLEGFLLFIPTDGRIVIVSPTNLKVVLIINA